MLRCEHGAAGLVHSEAELVAVPIGIDGRMHIVSAEEGIVAGNAAVIVEAQYLAEHVVQLLGLRTKGCAGGHVDAAVVGEGDAHAAGAAGLAGKQFLDIGDPAIVPASAHQRRDAGLAIPVFRAGPVVAEIQPVVAGEIRVQGEIVQAAVPVGFRQRGHARHRVRVKHGSGTGGIVDNAQVAAAFGDEQVAVRQEGQAEGARQSPGEQGDFDFVLLRRVKYIRRFFQHEGVDADGRLLCGHHLAGSDNK